MSLFFFDVGSFMSELNTGESQIIQVTEQSEVYSVETQPIPERPKFDIRAFYDKATFLGNDYHFVPRTRIVNGIKECVYDARSLVRYGFRRSTKLSNLHNCPVLFYIYLAEDGYPIFRKKANGEDYPPHLDLIQKNVHPRLPNGELAEKLQGQLYIPENVASEVSVLCDKVVEMMPNVDQNYGSIWFKNFRQINPRLETLEELEYLLKTNPDPFFLQYQIPEIFIKMLRDYFSQIPFYSRNVYDVPKYLSSKSPEERVPVIEFWSPQLLIIDEENQIEFYGRDFDVPFLIFFDDKQGEVITANDNNNYGEKILVQAPIFEYPQEVELSLLYFRYGSYFRAIHHERIIFN
jgi:hypothetical protein